MKTKIISNGTAVKKSRGKIFSPETVFSYLDRLHYKGYGYWRYAEFLSEEIGCTLKEGHDIMEEWRDIRFNNSLHNADLMEFL